MAQQLRTHGVDAAVLQGGYAAWRAAFPVEPKGGEKPAPVTIELHEKGSGTG